MRPPFCGILPEEPGGAGIGLSNLFEYLDIGQWVELGTAQRARQQHAEEAALDQRIDHPLQELTALLYLVRSSGQHRRDLSRPLQIIEGRIGTPQIE